VSGGALRDWNGSFLPGGPWFQLASTLALFPDVHQRSGRPAAADVAVTLRFETSRHWLVQLEGHVMNGNGGVEPVAHASKGPLNTLCEPGALSLSIRTFHFFIS